MEGGVRGAVGGILLEPLQWHQLLTPKGWKRLTTEGHTFADAILTVAMAQIGMLLTQTLPAYSLTTRTASSAHVQACSQTALDCQTVVSARQYYSILAVRIHLPMRHRCLCTTVATGLPLLQQSNIDAL